MVGTADDRTGVFKNGEFILSCENAKILIEFDVSRRSESVRERSKVDLLATLKSGPRYVPQRTDRKLITDCCPALIRVEHKFYNRAMDRLD